jgi:hypothetical protein
MPSDRPSRADEELVERLENAEIEGMTWTRLKRWRKAGLLPHPAQFRVPGQRGSTSSYPEGTFKQALAVDKVLKRHRNIDKAAILLFLADYEIDVTALRRAILNALDWLDDEIGSAAAGSSDPNEVAHRVGQAIVAERPRTKEARALRRSQLKAAGDEQRLASVYAALIRPYIGTPLAAGGLLGAFKKIGPDLRAVLDLDPDTFSPLELRLDANDMELNEAGGIGTLLRANVNRFELANFEALRSLCRDAMTWTLSLGFRLDAPNQFMSDLTAALYREPPNTEQ